MPQLEVFVTKLVSINAFASSSVASGEISPLQHKVRDDTVECASFVVQRLSLAAATLLSSAQSSKER